MVDLAESLVLLTAEQARAHVGSTLGEKVSRTTFYRWRDALNLSPPYSLDAVAALSVYGKCIKASRRSSWAKTKTVQLLRENGL